MITIFGPSCPSKVLPNGGDEFLFPALEPLLTDAKTLGDALAAYSREYGVRFRAYDGSNPLVPFEPGEQPKYFFYDKDDGPSHLVDIHVERGNEIHCPKQDLSFPLQPGDEVNIGPLAC